LFLVGLIAPLNRGPIIAFVVVMALFLMVEGKVGSLVKYALIAVAIGALSWPILSRRFSKENASSDVKSSLQMRSYKNFNTTGGGSFEFRLLLLQERLDYILNHPQYIATGIGMRHEDSQKTFNQFHFYLGAIKVDKATDKKLIQQIDTTDLVWATMLLRLGFVGVALYLIMFFIMLKLFYERRKEPLSTIGLLLVAMYLLNSFASDVLTRPSSFFIYFLVYAYALRAKTFVFTIEKKQQPTTN
jgi:O-antigen ligase